jgi:fibronectin type 3 domain-containing protein
LNPDTAYFFKVTAVNSGGESELSNSISGRTLPPPPTGVKAKTFNSIASIIEWNLLKDATSYNIYRAQSSSGPYEIIEQNWDWTIYSDTDLEKETVYYYKISAVFRNTVEGEKSTFATVRN